MRELFGKHVSKEFKTVARPSAAHRLPRSCRKSSSRTYTTDMTLQKNRENRHVSRGRARQGVACTQLVSMPCRPLAWAGRGDYSGLPATRAGNARRATKLTESPSPISAAL